MRLVVVLGYARRGLQGLDPVAAARVRRAEAVARVDDVVVVSGTPAEVAAMVASWAGQGAVLSDTAARRTADSAGAAAALARVRGVTAVLVVTSWWHVPRALFLFRSVVGRRTRVRAVAAGGPWRLWDVVREVLALGVAPFQALRARDRACATLERAPT